MPEVAVLVKVGVEPVDVARIREYRSKNIKALKAAPGFQDLTVWESVADPRLYLIVIDYADEESAEAGLRVSLKAGSLVGSLTKGKSAPLVRRGTVNHRHGCRADAVPIGAFASISFRVAEPGRGQQLAGELSHIFGELSMIDGYLGSFTCRNEALREEVIGVVFWSTRKAFEASLPSKMLYEVELYQRTG